MSILAKDYERRAMQNLNISEPRARIWNPKPVICQKLAGRQTDAVLASRQVQLQVLGAGAKDLQTDPVNFPKSELFGAFLGWGQRTWRVSQWV